MELIVEEYVDIINGINETFIEISKGEVLDIEISEVTNKYNKLLKEKDDVYRCVRTLSIDDILIDKRRIHIKHTMILWRELKLPVTPSTHLLEDHFLTQMGSIDGGIADKTEDHIERSHQVGIFFEQRYKYVTDFTQSQTSQIKLQEVLSQNK